MDEDLEKSRYALELKRFRGAEERQARAAMDWLATPARRYLSALLRDRLSRDDLEEVVQTALAKAWLHRLTFVNQGRAAWFGWLKRIGHNAYVDLIRTRRPDVPIDDLKEIEDDELPLLERFMTSALGKELFHLADVVWLELDESLSPADQDRRLLAAQYFYLDDWSVEELLAHLSETRPESPPVTRAQLNAWLETPGTLRYLAYHELHYSPARLTVHLLGLPTDSTACDVERELAAMRADPAPNDDSRADWTCPEAQAILWRYYRGLTVEEIAPLIKNMEVSDSLDALFVRCSQQFPFYKNMVRICAWLDNLDYLGIERQTLVGGKSRLWYRLAFEYRYRHTLPHRDIHERVHGAASVVPYEITLDMLTAWLSSGRLLDKLRQRYERRQSGQAHA